MILKEYRDDGIHFLGLPLAQLLEESMKLLDNWRAVLTKAWSQRLIILSAALSALEVALPFFTDFVPPRTMAVLALLTASAAAIARLIAQPKTLP